MLLRHVLRPGPLHGLRHLGVTTAIAAGPQADAPAYPPPAHGLYGLPNTSPAMRRGINPLKLLGGSTLTNTRLGFEQSDLRPNETKQSRD
jgi:hypothetical protein